MPPRPRCREPADGRGWDPGAAQSQSATFPEAQSRLEAPRQGQARLGFLGGPGEAGTPFPLQGAQTALAWVLLVPLGPRLCPPPARGLLPAWRLPPAQRLLPASRRDCPWKQPPSLAPTGLGPELVSLVFVLGRLKPQQLSASQSPQ